MKLIVVTDREFINPEHISSIRIDPTPDHRSRLTIRMNTNEIFTIYSQEIFNPYRPEEMFMGFMSQLRNLP